MLENCFFKIRIYIECIFYLLRLNYLKLGKYVFNYRVCIICVLIVSLCFVFFIKGMGVFKVCLVGVRMGGFAFWEKSNFFLRY